MKAKYSIGDWIWVKIHNLENDDKEESYRFEITDPPTWDANEVDIRYIGVLVDFPDRGYWVTYQNLVLPYFAIKYDGRYLAKRDLAERKRRAETWFTDFNLHRAFVPRGKKEFDFGDLLCKDPRTFFVKERSTTHEVETVVIDGGTAVLYTLKRFNLVERPILRNSN